MLEKKNASVARPRKKLNQLEKIVFGAIGLILSTMFLTPFLISRFQQPDLLTRSILIRARVFAYVWKDEENAVTLSSNINMDLLEKTFSPDGERIFGNDEIQARPANFVPASANPPQTVQPLLISRDGSKRISVGKSGETLIHASWLKEEGAWFQMTRDNSGTHTGEFRNVKRGLIRKVDFSGTWQNSPFFAGIAPDNSLVAFSDQKINFRITGSGQVADQIGYTYDLNSKSASIGALSLPMNSDDFLSSIALSPDGSRFVYVLERIAVPNPIFLRLFHNIPNYCVGYSVWECKRDMGATTLLGSVPPEKGAPHSLKWTPSGNAVSYIYDNALYRISVPSAHK